MLLCVRMQQQHLYWSVHCVAHGRPSASAFERNHIVKTKATKSFILIFKSMDIEMKGPDRQTDRHCDITHGWLTNQVARSVQQLSSKQWGELEHGQALAYLVWCSVTSYWLCVVKNGWNMNENIRQFLYLATVPVSRYRTTSSYSSFL